MLQPNRQRENNAKALTQMMSVSGTVTGKTQLVRKQTAMQIGTTATGIRLKVTHAVIGRLSTISCTAEFTLMINGKTTATIETPLEPTTSATGTTWDVLLWVKTSHGIIATGMRIAQSLCQQILQKDRIGHQVGTNILDVRRQKDVHQANPQRENNVKALTHQMNVSGIVTGKIPPVQRLTATQTGTLATGTHLKVTHAAIGRVLTISCTAECTLTINTKIGATIETQLELSINVTGTT